MVAFFTMKKALPSETKRKPDADSDWLKTPYPNLIRYKPSGNYFGRVRVNGKLIRLHRLGSSLRQGLQSHTIQWRVGHSPRHFRHFRGAANEQSS